MKRIIFLKALVFSILAGCYRDNEKDLYPAGGHCDSAVSTYLGTVAPLLQSYGCIGCHSGTAPSGNISLSGYSNVKAAVVKGTLYGSINHNPGFSFMPKGGNKMSDCAIQKIKAWIDSGSPNN